MDDYMVSLLVDTSDPIMMKERKNFRSDHFQNYYIMSCFVQACNDKNVEMVKKMHSKYDQLKDNKAILALDEDTFSTEESTNRFKRAVLDELIDACYEEFQNDFKELLFFAAAKFEMKKLEEIIHILDKEGTLLETINRMRNTDSIILFVLKYADISDDNFYDCIKLLVRNGVDTNKFDKKGRTAIDFVASLYHQYKSNSVKLELTKVAELLLVKGIYSEIKEKTKIVLTEEMELELTDDKYIEMDQKSKLFFLINKNKIDELLRIENLAKYANCDNGEHTLLQFAVKKSDDMLPFVQRLLKNKADPNLTTPQDQYTPLQLAMLTKNQKIFKELLANNETVITQIQFNQIVKWSTSKINLFKILLESDKLDVSMVDEVTGNTPLHYAIIFSHKKAIKKLLKRGSSLTAENKNDISILDIIHPKDLEIYYDSCLVLDTQAFDFTTMNYKMKLNFFRSLIDDRKPDELHISSEIANNSNLRYLLKHPLVITFIELKWYKSSMYFWTLLIIQALLLSSLGVSLYLNWYCEYFFVLNVITKMIVFIISKEHLTTHAFFEGLLIVINYIALFRNDIRPFVFIVIAICFLMTAGYHPKISKWCLMLQKVFKTFTVTLIFFSLIVLAFSMGFHLLFSTDDNHEFFRKFHTTIFRTFIMTVGDFNTDKFDFTASGSGGYLILLIFALSVSLVIVNFWTAIAITDIAKIEKDSEIKAVANVVGFMVFIERIYNKNYLEKLLSVKSISSSRNSMTTSCGACVKSVYKYVKECVTTLVHSFQKPFLFLKLNNTEDYYDKNKCTVDFYLNRNKHQFGDKMRKFPPKVSKICLNEIKQHCYKLHEKRINKVASDEF